jgi:hypothetical protein
MAGSLGGSCEVSPFYNCSAPTLLNERRKWKSLIATKHYYLILNIIRDYKSNSGIPFF